MSEPRYILAMSGNDIATCIRCDSEVPTTFASGLAHEDWAKRDLSGRICKFCFETELGCILAYPRQAPPGHVTMARAIAQALNIIHWDGKPALRENVDE